MATSESMGAYILDQLGELPSVFIRKMFGEYALYSEGKVVALICRDTLFVKITDPGKEFVGKNYKEGFAYPGARASMEITEGLLADQEWITQLISITEENVPFPKPKKKRKK